MSNAKKFGAEYERLADEASAKVEAICQDLDGRLESLATEIFGKAEGRENDGFGPPAIPVLVKCLHCADRYESDKMVWAYRPRMQNDVCLNLGYGISNLSPLWWCKNEWCDGGGFGHDIHPVKQRSTKKAAA